MVMARMEQGLGRVREMDFRNIERDKLNITIWG